MYKKINIKNIMLISFMIFVMFIGAGNIIIPPLLGYNLKINFFANVIGFSFTAVLLPLLTLIILSKLNGIFDNLSLSIGKLNGLILITICYLIVGPLCAVPRTATISFEITVSRFFENKTLPLFLYSLIYFSIIILISLYPKKILNFFGNSLAFIKFISLIILIISILFIKINLKNELIENKNLFKSILNGINNGYLTMDMISALVFGAIILDFSKKLDIKNSTYNIFLSSIIAGLSMIITYLSLFKIGVYNKYLILSNNINGVNILNNYITNIFGKLGNIFITILIFTTCLITAVGLTCSCSIFFSKYIPISYNKIVYILGILPMILSNFGLNKLINFSIPILQTVYPSCILMIFLSFIFYFFKKYKKIGIWIIFSNLIINIIYSFYKYIN